MSGSLLLCYCDECLNFPNEERWLPQYTVQYHKANNLFGGVAFNEWAAMNDEQFFDMAGLSEQDVNNDIELMDADDDEFMEEDFSIMATGDDEEWPEVATSAFEPEEVTTEVVEIDEVDQLADTFASSKVPSSAAAKILFAMVVKLHNKYTTHEGTEYVMECLNQVMEETGDSFRFPKRVPTFLNRTTLLNGSTEGVKAYVVCPKCHALHEKTDGAVICDKPMANAIFIPTHASFYCTGNLLALNNRVPATLSVQMEYAYCSVEATLKKFFRRRGFADQLAQWKHRRTLEGYYLDLQDATMFNTFKALPTDAVPFAHESNYNLQLALNIDWFSPFEHSYSVGCIYMSILNLPKKDGRDLKKNMILVGVIPGPSEPSTTAINHYLRPLVNELLVLMKGVDMPVTLIDGKVVYNKVRAAISLISCDLPATKKLIGSLSYNGHRACHMCDLVFPSLPGGVSRHNYCNWNCDSWPRKDPDATRQASEDWLRASSGVRRKEVEKATGSRYSILNELPYFSYDLVALEPMHCLYLGIAKRCISAMIPLTSYEVIQQKMKKMIFNPNHSCGPLSNKIGENGFHNVKAVEFQDFVVGVASLVLKGVVQEDEYAVVMNLIKAFKILEGDSIAISDIEVVHNYLLAFAVGYERLYSHDLVTPNFHFMLHLRDSMRKWGPVSCFWGFNFERNNMFVKRIRTNHRQGLEKTYMNKMQSIIFSEDFDFLTHNSSN